jgi:nucleoid DNA-binding protein
MFAVTLHIILILFVLSEAFKIWMESKTWNENFKSQSKNKQIMPVIEGHFDRSELIQLTLAEVGEPLNVVSEIVKTAFRILAEQTALHGYATIENFGSFQVHEIPARSGIDPDGNPYDAPERLTVEFNAEKQFRGRLAELSGKKVIA